MTDEMNRRPIRARLDSTGKTTTTSQASDPYRTTSTELAAFLRAAGHPLLNSTHDGRRVWFSFGDTSQRAAEAAAMAFSAGEEISAVALFQHWREVRDVVNEVLRREKGGRG